MLPLALLAAFACGDDGTDETSAEGSTGTTATGGTTGPGTSGPGTSGPGTTGPGTTETGPTNTSATSTGLDDTTAGSSTEGSGTTQGTDDTSGSGEGSTTEGSSTTGDENVVYAAVALPGGLDRIRITKANLGADRCTWLVLVAPPIGSPYPSVVGPAGWSVESIQINDVAVACDSDDPAMFGSEPALDGMGTIGFGMLGGTGIYPCTVDVDAVFDFQGVLPGIPPMDDMVAADVPVTGC
ncbi:MAG: hypothetical protein KDK70_21140 [Myxococcales bacterium]|nr:hypothetical protein [Myxococcales bacterium]